MLETNTTGSVTTDQRYYAYGRQRDAGPVVTDYRFTGQKEDGTGLVYMNARYYDPVIGQFISPDTIVPDATNVFDYNRYMYVRGNPLRYNDPSGHDPACIGIPIPFFAISCHAGSWVIQNGPTVVNLVSQWIDKLPAVGDWFFGSSNAAEQGSHSAGQQNAGDSSTGDPNDLDPNKIQQSANKGNALLENVSKADARTALKAGIDGLSKGQTERAFDLLGKGRVDSFSINMLQNNQAQMVADRGGFDGFQRLIYTIDSSGRVLGMIQEAYNSAGELVHVHDKLSGVILK